MMMHLVAALGLHVLGTPGSGLSVETTTPDALCPDIETTRAAVGSRLGIVDIEDRAGWRAVYSVGHAPQKGSGDFVRIELFDPARVLRLRRDVPRESEPCASMAQVIALVIERYFRSLTAPGSSPSQASIPSLPSSSAAPPSTTGHSPKHGLAVAVPSADEVMTATQDREKHRITLLTGASAALLFPKIVAAPELHLRVHLAQHIELDTRVVVPPERTSEIVGPGWAHLYTIPVRLGVNWVGVGPRTQFAMGPEMLFSVERGWTEGLDQMQDRLRLVVGVGLHLDARYWLTRHLGVLLAGGIDVIAPFSSSRFVVNQGDVLDNGVGRGFASIGVLVAWNGVAWNASEH